jgi:Transport and Golgi organisation 2
MCFVTYLPYQDGFILTSNRDEHAGRPAAVPPRKYSIAAQNVFYPKDGLAGGTWLATSCCYTLCLLNGAFEPHKPQPPYRQSRGKVLLDFFEINNLSTFISTYDFAGIEPFTLVVVHQKNTPELHQLRWDGQQLHHQPLEAQRAFAWSSVTLYTPDTVQERARWFGEWQAQHPNFSGQEVIDFHLAGGNGDQHNDLVINRDNLLQTVSVTQVQQTTQQLLMHYHDRLKGQEYRYRILQ